jgi:hypothetical protein
MAISHLTPVWCKWTTSGTCLLLNDSDDSGDNVCAVVDDGDDDIGDVKNVHTRIHLYDNYSDGDSIYTSLITIPIPTGTSRITSPTSAMTTP